MSEKIDSVNYLEMADKHGYTMKIGQEQKSFTQTVMSETLIFVKFALPGIHCYPDAPDDVSYLRSPHRHMFHFKVGVNVTHANRDIEFHQFLNWCKSQYTTNTLELSYKSCEMIAQELSTLIFKDYKVDKCIIEVWEDDECGAVLTAVRCG